MLLARASPSFLPSTSTPSTQTLPPSASFGRNQRIAGGSLTAGTSHCAVRRPVMAAAAATVPAAKLEDAEALIDSVETFIFDCDGATYTDHLTYVCEIDVAFLN